MSTTTMAPTVGARDFSEAIKQRGRHSGCHACDPGPYVPGSIHRALCGVSFESTGGPALTSPPLDACEACELAWNERIPCSPTCPVRP